GPGFRGDQFFRQGDGRLLQRGVAFADLAQRPVHGLLDEVAFIFGGAPDERKRRYELFLRGFLVVHGQGGEQGEGGAAFVLRFAPGPFADLAPGEGRSPKEGETAGVAYRPTV